MARTHGHGKLPKKQLKKTPEIFFDSENDFASKSYEKDGFIFSEDAKGKIIEIQILNLSLLSKSSKKSA
jgi:hypothetical protein